MSMITSFRAMHSGDLFVLPNPWDVGSARLLQSLGFPALATTSSGLALSLGQTDGDVDLDRLAAHVEAIAGSVSVPVNVDSERLFADDPGGLAEVIGVFVAAGAAGLSIEDYDRAAGGVDPVQTAVERVEAAAVAASRSGVVLTARAENHIRGVDDFDDTIERLRAYRDAGADVLYAPGLVDLREVEQVVALGLPVNVLALPAGPSVAALASVGVQRVSIGGAFARAAYGALIAAATEVNELGTSEYQEVIPGFSRFDELLSRRGIRR